MIAWLVAKTGIDALIIKLWLFIALMLVVGLGKCAYDKGIIAKHDAKITRETMETDFKAKLEAADHRARDQASIANDERKRSDAIQKAPDSKPAAARNALNCERLRRAGQDTSRIAACAGLGD